MVAMGALSSYCKTHHREAKKEYLLVRIDPQMLSQEIHPALPLEKNNMIIFNTSYPVLGGI